MKTHKWSELRDKMPDDARQEVKAKVEAELARLNAIGKVVDEKNMTTTVYVGHQQTVSSYAAG